VGQIRNGWDTRVIRIKGGGKKNETGRGWGGGGGVVGGWGGGLHISQKVKKLRFFRIRSERKKPRNSKCEVLF